MIRRAKKIKLSSVLNKFMSLILNEKEHLCSRIYRWWLRQPSLEVLPITKGKCSPSLILSNNKASHHQDNIKRALLTKMQQINPIIWLYPVRKTITVFHLDQAFLQIKAVIKGVSMGMMMSVGQNCQIGAEQNIIQHFDILYRWQTVFWLLKSEKLLIISKSNTL